MIETDGAAYEQDKYAKALMCASSKVGKTTFLVASALGVLPWQKFGGVIDDPKNLHLITFDTNAAGGVARFLTETCGAPKEALGFRVYNLQEEAAKASLSQTDWDFGFYNSIRNTLDLIGSRAKGVPVVIFSSITGAVQSLERALGGPPGQKKGNGMDMAKWGDLGRQISELRSAGHAGKWHCLWEAHVTNIVRTSQGGEESKESLMMSGTAGKNFALNVAQVFRLRRMFGQAHEKTKCDQVYLDTRPTMDFVSNGRSFTEALDAKEQDMTVCFKKLGLEVGRWNAKKS